MGFYRVKIDAADREFSKYIRARDSWTCVKCHRKHPEGSGTLGNSHYFPRRIEATRFDPDNCDSLCNMPCHAEWEHEKWDKKGNLREYGIFKLNQFGAKRYALLEIRAATRVKRDRKMALLIARHLLTDLLLSNGVFGKKA